MSAQLTNAARVAFAKGQINWTYDTIRVVLLNSSLYTYNTSDAHLSDIPSAAILFTSPPLSNCVVSSFGACTADTLVVPSVSSNSPIGAMYIYKDTGDPTTSTLIMYIPDYSGMPATTTGGQLTIIWPAPNVNGIFTL